MNKMISNSIFSNQLRKGQKPRYMAASLSSQTILCSVELLWPAVYILTHSNFR